MTRKNEHHINTKKLFSRRDYFRKNGIYAILHMAHTDIDLD